MWPAVKKGLDVIAVSPSDSGKTYGYLVPILSSLVNQAKVCQYISSLVIFNGSYRVSSVLKTWKVLELFFI